MSQADINVIKTVESMMATVNKKTVKLNEICESIKTQMQDVKYTENVLSGTDAFITPFFEVIDEAFLMKKSGTCVKAIDFIQQLIEKKFLISKTMTYHGESLDVGEILVNILSATFKYISLPTNLPMAKCLKTVVEVFNEQLNPKCFKKIFVTLYDLAMVVHATDPNIVTYQSYLENVVSVVLTNLDAHSENPKDQTAKAVVLSKTLFDEITKYSTSPWTECNRGVECHTTYVNSITNEAKILINAKSRKTILPFEKTFFEKLSPFCSNKEFFDPQLVAQVSLSLILNANDTNTEVIQSCLDILGILVDKYRQLMTDNLGVIMSRVVIHLLNKQSVPIQLQVLNFLKSFFTLPNIAEELFFNYDCNVDAPNLYETIIRILVSLFSIPETCGLSVEILLCVYSSFYEVTKEYSEDVLKNNNNDENAFPIKKYDVKCLKQTKNLITEGLTVFAKSAKQGVLYFIEKKLCENTPQSIMAFLRQFKVDRIALGDYLGGAGETNQKCLELLLNTLDFKDKPLDLSMREMFDQFVMGGEGQVVERVINAFSRRFSECNPGIFNGITADEIYQITMTVICLSTEKHNPSAKIKVFDTFDKFSDVIVTDKGFNIKLDKEQLRGIFERVEKTPFLIQKDDTTSKAMKITLKRT
ncbi:Sec7 domain containing protein, partial [Entamoeba invadens IP1]